MSCGTNERIYSPLQHRCNGCLVNVASIKLKKKASSDGLQPTKLKKKASTSLEAMASNQTEEEGFLSLKPGMSCLYRTWSNTGHLLGSGCWGGFW